MSFFDSITKKSKLKAAVKQTMAARNSEGSKADQLFKRVYQDYAEIVAGELLIAEALYNWGFALLHQAKNKSGEQAEALYQDAIEKFTFCLLAQPSYLGAAIDGGVAYMELARVKRAGPHDALYVQAHRYFEKANAIQSGSAAYNMACIYALRGDKEACLNALELADSKGILPVADDILNDPDLAGVKGQAWFAEFIDSLAKKPELLAEDGADAEPVVDAVADDVAAESDAAVNAFKSTVETQLLVDTDAAASEKSEEVDADLADK
ncbi:MAG: hypothetical protein U1E09_11380 [Methylococcales bacterium]|nr:hypothetical protein [Methylobacter sp.]MDP2099212.1 hypothetical protein [Methylobacter sp.]MDP2428412.1 hypothetical protein [Methylobacter sp.]MDZ4157143.1 hypothetical protein [Methylococcales bacterium]